MILKLSEEGLNLFGASVSGIYVVRMSSKNLALITPAAACSAV